MGWGCNDVAARTAEGLPFYIAEGLLCYFAGPGSCLESAVTALKHSEEHLCEFYS